MKHLSTLSRSKTGLLVIDMQEKFAPVIPDFESIVLNTVKLVLTFQMFRMPVIITEQYPKGLGPTVEKIRMQFSLLEVVEKMSFSCIEEPAFWRQVSPLGLETIVVCGVEAHVCVNQTVLGLIKRGLRVHVVADTVGSRNKFDTEIALRKMEQAGAILATTEMALFELTERAGTESFKHVQKMVKKGSSVQATAQPIQHMPRVGKTKPGSSTVASLREPANKLAPQETLTEKKQETSSPVKSPLSMIAAAATERSRVEEKTDSDTPDTGDLEQSLDGLAGGELPELQTGLKDTSVESESPDSVDLDFGDMLTSGAAVEQKSSEVDLALDDIQALLDGDEKKD